ncbi:MAG: hypothetical protein KME06_02945, partial [Kastovskya adunca ATA6-11-RM4]|nr:hypothetical protein [Kastovskya adunca ATA6-11-RM4]
GGIKTKIVQKQFRRPVYTPSVEAKLFKGAFSSSDYAIALTAAAHRLRYFRQDAQILRLRLKRDNYV